MTEHDSPEKAPVDGRGVDGRFAPGNNLGIPFGPDVMACLPGMSS